MRFICGYEGSFNTWTKCELLYPTAAATLYAGRGIKTEGDMVITGTQGYLYVPAPWWKLEYFEVRGEDLRDTKKHYYECAGEGMRYEAFEFPRLIRARKTGREEYPPVQSQEEVLAVTALIEQYAADKVVKLGASPFGFGGGETVTDR